MQIEGWEITVRWLLLVCIFCLGSFCPPAFANSGAFDFKGIPLGISLTEFRNQPHPDQKNSRVICTGDKDSRGYAHYQVSIYDETEKSAGVVKCIFFGASYVSAAIEQSVGLNMGGGNYASYDYGFYFAPDPKTKIMRLYKIVLPTNVNAMGDVVSALTDKFGPTKSVRTGTVQNRMGANFPQKIYVWRRQGFSIQVEGPWSKIDNMAVVYLDENLARAVDTAAGAAKAAKPNRM